MADRDDNGTLGDPLSIDEINVLIEAVEAWESEGDSGEFVADMLMAMIVKPDDPQYAAFTASQQKTKDRRAEEKRDRKERSILLRAKLIGMLDARRAIRLIGGVR